MYAGMYLTVLVFLENQTYYDFFFSKEEKRKKKKEVTLLFTALILYVKFVVY